MKTLNTAELELELQKHKKRPHKGMGFVQYGCSTCRMLEYALANRKAKGKP
jgi:hypothetical protein